MNFKADKMIKIIKSKVFFELDVKFEDNKSWNHKNEKKEKVLKKINLIVKDSMII